MKFNGNLYELTKVLPKYDEELNIEELDYEEKVFESLINKINKSKSEDGLIRVRYVSNKFNKNGDEDFELINYLIVHDLFNKIFNQYCIYYTKLTDEVYDYDEAPIEITWDYKRYKEGLNTKSIQSQIATYEVRKNIEKCREEGHIFDTWKRYKIVRRVPGSMDSLVIQDIDESYYSRTCKRCGYVEKTFDNPELHIDNLRTFEDEVYEYQMLKIMKE